MFKVKEDRIRFLGPALLTVIWFLLLNAFLQNSIETAHTGAFLYQIKNIRKSTAPSNNSTHLYSLPVSLSTISETNFRISNEPVSYTHLRAHETRHDLVCRLLLEKKKKK